MDADGKCTDCRRTFGFVKNQQTGKCECQKDKPVYHTDILGGYQCKLCSELIDGCQACDYTRAPSGRAYKEIGLDNDISRSEEQAFVECVVAAKTDTLVEVEEQVDDGSGQTTTEKVVKKCDEVIPGCARCNDNGDSCLECNYGFYIFSRNGVNRCNTCDNQ